MRKMTKLLSLLVMLTMSVSMWADGERAGFWSDNASTIRFIKDGAQDDVTFNNSGVADYNLGTVQTLVVNEWWFKMWQSAENIPGNGVAFYYKVYPEGDATSEVTTNWGNYCSFGDWNNGSRNAQAGNNAANINLLENLSGGAYILEFYYTANIDVYGTTTANAGPTYLSNNSQNYKINFFYPGEVRDEFDVNYAIGATATASTGNAGEAIDGNNGSRWESASEDPQWWQVDLGQPCVFNTIQILWEGAYSKNFTISVSNDATDWTEITNVENNAGGGAGVTQTFEYPETVTARFIKFNSTVRATIYGNSFWEFRVIKAAPAVLTTVELAVPNKLPQVNTPMTLTPTAKDQLGNPMADQEFSYTISPADAGEFVGNVYTPTKVGFATITLHCADKQASVEVFNVPSANLALCTNENGKLVAQSSQENSSALRALGSDEGITWQGNPNGEVNEPDLDCWFVVDLGEPYAIDLVTIKFEGANSAIYNVAYSQTFDSENAEAFATDDSNWTVAYSFAHDGQYAHTDFLYPGTTQKYVTENTVGSGSAARYVRFRSTKSATGWGMKMYYFKVFGSLPDTENPTISEAGCTERHFTTAEMQMTATDNLGLHAAYVEDLANDFSGTFLLDGNNFTVTGLDRNKNYTLTVYAVDRAANRSESGIEVVLPFYTGENLALKMPCTGGYCQFNNSTEESRAKEYKKANDGNPETTYSAFQAPENEAWWQVDLGTIYNLSRVDITFGGEYSSNYTIKGSFEGEKWFDMASDAATAANTMKSTTIVGATRFVKVFSVDRTVLFNEIEVYGTGFGAADSKAPVITTFEAVSTDATSVELHIVASDVNDKDELQPVTYTVAGNNDFETQNVVLNGENKATLTGLKKNCDYTFTLTVTDPASNTAVSNPVVVRMQFDPSDNLALNKPAEASAIQGDGVKAPKANDGNTEYSNFWTPWGNGDANAWWKVDLGYIFELSTINVYWHERANNYTIYGSFTGEDDTWFPIITHAPVTDNTKYELTVNAAARYLKLVANKNTITLTEVEVFGSAYATTDGTAPEVTVTEVSKTINTATIKIVATDKDDANVEHPVKNIKIEGDNDFTTIANAQLDGEGKIELSGLTFNTTYHFTVTVTDRVGNETVSEALEVVLPFNTELNIAPSGTAYAADNETGRLPEHANDNNGGTFWNNYGHEAEANIWTLDLHKLYNVDSIIITTPGIGGNRNVDIEASYDNINWIKVKEQTTIGNNSAYKYENLNVLAQYFRVVGPTNLNIGFYEFKVYASGFGTADTEAPVITGAEVSEITYSTAKITLDASDNVGIITCQVTDGVNRYDKTFDVVNGQFTVDDLATLNGKTYYNFTLVAKDLAGNSSEEFVLPQFRTLANPAINQLASISATTDKVLCSTSETVTITPACKDQHDAEFTTVTYEYNVDAACGVVSEEGVFTPAEEFRGWATISVTATSETDFEEVQSTSVKVYVANDNIALNTAHECNADACTTGGYALVNLTDGDTSKKWQGSAKADALTEGATRDNLEAWFVLDLKDKYQIGVIVIDFDGASAQSYDILYSVNGVDYTKAFDRTRNLGGDDDKRTDILHANMSQQYFSVDENIPAEARYVKFVCRRSSPWGVRVREVYVYGTLVADTEKPVITSATVREGSIGEDQVTLDVVATDNIGVTHVRVFDEANGVNVVVALEDNAATVTGLVPGTTYNFSVYARDLQENESEVPAIVAAFQTVGNNAVPHVAAPAPKQNAIDVTSIYSNAYTSAVKDGFSWKSWNSTSTVKHLNIGGNDYTIYYCGAGGEFGIGDKFKKASDNTTGINISNRDYMHVDVWTTEEWGLGITLNDNRLVLNYRLVPGWNSIDLPLSTLRDGTVTAASVKEGLEWIKFTEINGRTIAIDNIYFWDELVAAIGEAADNTDEMAQFNNRYVNVTLNRGFTNAGELYTFCVPFDMDEEQIVKYFGTEAEVWKMIGSETRGNMIHIDFEEQSKIVAGVPYLLRPSKEFTSGTTIEGVIVSDTQGETIGDGDIQMHGYVNKKDFTAADHAYFLFSDAYLHELQAKAGATYNGLRAYFTFESAPAAGARARIRLGETVTTDIETLESEANIELQKVLMNGNIYIIRDGRMYNVQGQLMK